MAKCKRGDGSVHLRKDGRWEGRYVVGRDDKGLPTTKNVLAKTKSECLAKLKALQESLQPSNPESIPTTPQMTFGEWLAYWYQNDCKPNLRPKTQADYENRIYQHIIPALGPIPLTKLTRDRLQQFYADLRQNGRLIRTDRFGPGLSPRMVRCCHVTCRKALDKAMERGLIARNPAAHCKLPASPSKEMRILTQPELQRLLIQAKEDGCFELLVLELSTGLRRGEILALRWNDLDVQTGTLRVDQRIKGELVVSQPKTKTSVRTIRLPQPLLAILTAYREKTPSQWIFPSPRKPDSPRDPAAVRKKLSAVLERAGCKHIRFHDLRHTFATNALEKGMDIKTLSAIIGHVSSKTTLDVYAHVTDEMRRSAAAKIDRGVVGTEPPVEVAKKEPIRTTFQAVRGKYRKPGTGYVKQISPNCWQGRYSPKVKGKRLSRNVYAPTEAECEARLTELIGQMKAEISAVRTQDHAS